MTDYIKHYADDYDDWDRLLSFTMFAYNTSVHEATNFTLYELVFGRVARTPSSFPQGTELGTYGSYLRDLIVRITEIQKIRPLNARIGDTVYALKEIRDGKFDSRAIGPYNVAGYTENNNVILETEDGERIMKHKDKLLLAHC